MWQWLGEAATTEPLMVMGGFLALIITGVTIMEILRQSKSPDELSTLQNQLERLRKQYKDLQDLMKKR